MFCCLQYFLLRGVFGFKKPFLVSNTVGNIWCVLHDHRVVAANIFTQGVEIHRMTQTQILQQLMVNDVVTLTSHFIAHSSRFTIELSHLQLPSILATITVCC